MAFVTIRSFTSALAEGTDGPVTNFTFVIGRTPSIFGLPAATASYSVTGTGASPTNLLDFLSPPVGFVGFSAFQTTATVTIQVAGDLTLEANETFLFSLTGAGGLSFLSGTTSVVATVLNDDTIVGTPLGDILAGTFGSDGISGRAGNDVILASFGNDVINGGDGFDQIRYDQPGIGAVTLLADGVVSKASGGTDRLFNMERITASAAVANDTIDGRTSDAVQNTSFVINLGTTAVSTGGAAGVVAANSLRVNGIPGVGSISFAVDGFDNIFGTRNNDVFVGSSGNNTMSGDSGNDTFFGSTGNDTYTGGAGVDTLDYSALGRAVTLLPGGLIAKSGAGTDRAIDFIERFVGGAGLGNTLDASIPAGAVPPGGQTTRLFLDYSNTTSNNVTVTGLPIPGGTGSYQLVNFVHARGTANADSLTGSAATNSLWGNGGNDIMSGLGGNDFLDGGAGNDSLFGGDGNDRLLGGLGDDIIEAGNGVDSLDGGDGNDVLDGFGSGAKTMTGGNGNDSITGGFDNDLLQGGAGNDFISGASGDDILIGGLGRDTMIGFSGADTYRYLATSDSAVGPLARDVLQEFVRSEGDRIDISAIDANTTLAGNQAFSSAIRNREDFTGVAGQISVIEFESVFVLRFDTNGDALANFEIEVQKGGLFQPGAGFNWQATDFVL